MEPNIHDFIAEYIASGRLNLHKTTTTVKPTGFIGIKVQQSSPATFPVKQVKEILTARLFADGKLKLEVQGKFSAHFLRELAGC